MFSSQSYKFSKGLTAAGANSKLGCIGKTGKFVIRPQLDYAFKFAGGIAWIGIGDKAAVVTIALKFGAYLLTGAVGLLSDAIESCMNLLAGGVKRKFYAYVCPVCQVITLIYGFDNQEYLILLVSRNMLKIYLRSSHSKQIFAKK
ncbi:MAG: WG repeat-containing protein [Nostoc sp.]|uniref:WG repeat-containing protein n=1 Tax=Nostoc sp. TaxID=1180 RepID=UPI002FF57577